MSQQATISRFAAGSCRFRKLIKNHGKVNWGFVTLVNPNNHIVSQINAIVTPVPVPKLWNGSHCWHFGVDICPEALPLEVIHLQKKKNNFPLKIKKNPTRERLRSWVCLRLSHEFVVRHDFGILGVRNKELSPSARAKCLSRYPNCRQILTFAQWGGRITQHSLSITAQPWTVLWHLREWKMTILHPLRWGFESGCMRREILRQGWGSCDRRASRADPISLPWFWYK